MKTIIVYYSYSGNNEALAKKLKSRFGCDIVKLEEKKKGTGMTIMLDLLFKREAKIQEPDVYLEDYKKVIFIAPIWDAKVATPLTAYLKKEKEKIRSYAFITLCGGRPGQTLKIVEQLRELIGKKPIAFMELEVNELLPSGKKNNVKFVSTYKLKDEDLDAFTSKIQDFENKLFGFTKGNLEKRPQLELLN
jgi:flavodoxin